MKTTEDIKKYRAMTKEQLEKELTVLEHSAMTNKLRVAAGKLDNFSLVCKAKKNIARVETIINEKDGE